MRWPGRMAGEVLRHATQKPNTVNYPAVKVEMPPAFRGKLRFHAARCVGCKLCQKDCPAGALAIEKVGEKRFQAVFQFDRCIYCAQCVDSCNKDALESTTEYELATLDRATLRVTYAPEPPPPPPAAEPAPAAPAAANDATPLPSAG
ncbi:MAG TPA: 4Fe-4S dicluster domain-containing protein [Anaeromyxobacteraceae bacterium]|nr:4Fe-4S dicluster domain-containing protein [Anaeromyxobacteraceae bacterium]